MIPIRCHGSVTMIIPINQVHNCRRTSLGAAAPEVYERELVPAVFGV